MIGSNDANNGRSRPSAPSYADTGEHTVTEVDEPDHAPLSARWWQTVAATTQTPTDAPFLDISPGTLIGRYRLITQIAKGGMASVWIGLRERTARARASSLPGAGSAGTGGSMPGLEDVAAVKILFSHLCTDVHFVRMFLDEARLLHRIHHANVVGIRDVGSHESVPYVALDWVDGDSLQTLLKVLYRKGKELPLALALRIVGEVCLGLHFAHELRDPSGVLLSVVHRDVSPANVLLSATGDVKVIDFGVAKAVDRLAESTRSGVLKGKVSYMAPEQVLRYPIDRRTDVWAAGVMLYRLVGGRLPFEGDIVQVLRALQDGAPVPPLSPSVPRQVAEIVHTALAREPRHRYSTAAEMRRAIQYAYAEICAPVSKSQFASFVAGHLAERIAERRQALAQALQARNGLQRT